MIDDDRCRPVREHLSDEIDGEVLSPDVRVAMDAHLSRCPPCQRMNRSLLALKEALRALRDVDPPAALGETAERPAGPAGG